MENKLPEGWKWKKLGEIAEINPKFDRKSISENIEVTFLPMKCIEELTGNVDTSNIKNIEEVSKGYTPLVENDLLYAKITPCMENGKIAIAKGLKNNLGFASTEFHVIRFKNSACSKFFFFYLIQKRIREYAAMNMTGSAGQKRVPATFLKDLLIPLPPLETQQKIVSILEKAEETKKLRAQADELTQKLLQSVFLEMFGDPVENPHGFEIGEIGDLVIATQYGTSKKANEDGKGIPVLRMNNITYEGNWDLSSLKYIELDQKEMEKYLVYKGELLFNRTNSKELVGKSAVYKEEKPMAFAGYLIKLITESPATSEFIAGHLNSKYGKMYLENMAKSIVGMANINAQEVQRIPILLPSREIMKKYSRIVKQIEKAKKTQDQSSLEINTLFDALIQKAFTGELVS